MKKKDPVGLIVSCATGIGAVAMMIIMGPSGKSAGLGALLGGAIGLLIVVLIAVVLNALGSRAKKQG
ncbi:MAG: hypothetical protein ABSH50_16990 [Bryobacteraceae bacterium]|jgi:hypothetical protein